MREFRDIAAFLRHMAGVQFRMEQASAAGIERAAKLVKAEAQSEIGHYQEDNLGGFPPWAELADRTKDDRVRQGFSENEPGLRTGEMRDSIGYVVAPHEGVVGSDSQHLVWFDQGTMHQPPRVVLGVAAHRKAAVSTDLMAAPVVAALAGVTVTALVSAHGGHEEHEP